MTVLTVDGGADIGEAHHPQRLEVVWPSWLVPAGAEREWIDLQAVLAVVAVPCRAEPQLWFTSRVRPADFAAHEAAVEACSWCPALVECRAYAVAAGERDGVWGGLTAAERQAL